VTTPTVPNRAAMIGQAIRRVRFNVGFTQEDLASITGILRTNISKYENGKRMPSIDELYAIADACASPISELLPEMVATTSPAMQTIVQILTERPDVIPAVLTTLQHHIHSIPDAIDTHPVIVQ
jgi:transcriptional regulator with XRE-family HTH domain